MKASKLTYLMVLTLALSFVATGCRKKPTPLTDLPARTGERIPDPNIDVGRVKPEGDPSVGQPIPDIGDINNFKHDRAALAAHAVHFDYDSVAIRSGERANVQAVADFMKSAAANVALLVEGHCDERGTEEYNRALGERRALSLREALISAGADGQRIVTRTFGKDKKIDLGPSEASHAKNRRGEFVVLTPK
ncbi:MAG: OmpA family protein [Pedosphaera sp.]|nr:OmpA family protein [Pedosphaera sp.]